MQLTGQHLIRGLYGNANAGMTNTLPHPQMGAVVSDTHTHTNTHTRSSHTNSASHGDEGVEGRAQRRTGVGDLGDLNATLEAQSTFP